MALMTSLLLSLLPAALALPQDRRDANPLSTIPTSDLKKYAVPHPESVITEWDGMGDSFTAGVGSGDHDGFSQECYRYSNAYVRQMNENADLRMPGNINNRWLTHSACTGAKTGDINLYQTISGDRNNKLVHPKFGKSSLSAITLGGNDVGFSGLINNCIFQIFPLKTCAQQRQDSWALINDVNLELDIAKALIEVIRVGQHSQGADPPESFQIHVLPYVAYFNVDTEPCNEVTFGGSLRYPSQYLTKDLRSDMNNMVMAINAKIQTAVNFFADFGVFYTGDYQSGFDHHRFCEDPNGAGDPTSPDIWFYHEDSPLHDEDSGPTNTNQQQLDTLFALAFRPNGSTTADWDTVQKSPNPDIKTSDDVFNAIGAVANIPNIDPQLLPRSIRILRVFHPKKAGYTVMAKTAINSIQAHVPQISCADQSKIGGDSGVLLNTLMPQFCGRLGTVTISQTQDSGKRAYKFTFTKGTGEGQCNVDTCKTAYTAAIKSCQYDSHTIQKDGQIKLACGTFAWELDDAPTSSTQVPASKPAPAKTSAAPTCTSDGSPFDICLNK